jgi:ankyrin repeat protein
MHAATLADARMVALLLERGAEVNAKNSSGATALMRAAGDLEKVRLLLDQGADVNARSELGRTPLLIAATYPGNLETVLLLVARGADVKDQDPFGETCLTNPSKRGDAAMVRFLIEAGADVAAGGRPPLAWAAEEGNVATLKCLLEHGAAKNPQHLAAALSAAAARGPLRAVQLLLEHGDDPKIPSAIAGYTPLMWAAYSEEQNADIVRLLLAKGADPKAKGADAQTALDLAKKHGRTPIVELLEQAAATR